MFPFSVTHQLSQRDFLKVSFAVRYRHFSAYLITAGGLFFLGAGVFLSNRSDVIIGALICLLPALNIFIRTFILFRQFPYLAKSAIYVFTENDVQANRQGIEFRAPWSAFTKITTAARFVIINLSKREGIILPLSAFPPGALAVIRAKVSA